MIRKVKVGLLGMMAMIFAIPWSYMPAAYGAGKVQQAAVWRYQGDLGGWKELGPIKTEKGHVVVPLRKYIDLLGLPTEYNAATKQIVVQSVKTRLVLKPSSKTAVVNGKTKIMPLPLQSVNGVQWIPLEFISKVFPAKVTQHGYLIELQESYVIQKFGGEWFILHDQTGDLYFSPKGKYAPVKIGSMHHRLNRPELSVRKTANDNYYVTVYEFQGDGAIHSHEIYNSLYIRNNKELYQNTTLNYEHNFDPKLNGDQIAFVKGDEVLFIDDKTGQTVRTVPFGGGLVDIQDDVFVTHAEGYALYFPETGQFIEVYDLLDEQDRATEVNQITCPVSPRCGGFIAYQGREGNELVFTFKGKRLTYPLPEKKTSNTTGA